MNPIYNEYIKFLRDTSGEQLDFLKEGYFWLDNSIIKCFDYDLNIHKICRINIDNNLNVSINAKKNNGYEDVKDINIVNWNYIINANESRLNKLEQESLSLIKIILKKYHKYKPIILTSGGKDSSVTMHLVRKIDKNIKGIFNNTSLDCVDTYLHIKELENVETINPNEGFYQWRKRLKFVPTRFTRACCSIFKEGAMINKLDNDFKYLFFLGMRNQESNTRSDYLDEWRNEKWSINWIGCLPIRKWTELDIWMYILKNNISINQKYKKGYSRAGCAIACPFANKSTWVLDKYWYPFMRNRWENILKNDFIKNKKWIVMNCTINEFVNSAWNGGQYREEPTEEVIKEFAKYNGLDIGDTKVAGQYFNKYCANGCKNKKGKLKKIKDKDTIAMNLKFHGRDINKFLCKKCFMEMYNMTEEKWNWYIERFRDDGCALFDKKE